MSPANLSFKAERAGGQGCPVLVSLSGLQFLNVLIELISFACHQCTGVDIFWI